MILDIICAAVVVIFGLIGYFRGFARQVFGLASGLVALVGAYFLLMPAYELVYDLFLGSVIESVGGSLGSLTFLDSVATPLGKTTGTLLAEYVSMFVLYLALAFVVGIAWKLLKLIVYPICDIRGIRFFDKVFGILLGFAWGIIFVVALLYLATLVAGWEKLGLTTTINDFIDMIKDGSYFSERFIVDYLGKIETFFADVWTLIKNGISSVVA